MNASFPSPAEEELSDVMSFDDYLVENKEATYILRMNGDAMNEAGINDGDMVIVERTTRLPVGHIVVAAVDGEMFIRYLRKVGNGYYLESADTRSKPIFAEHELKVEAVVKAVVRKY